jgi:hypothetical protein
MVLIVDDLLKLPFDLGVEVLQAIADNADAELLNSERSVRHRVLETQMQFEKGDLPEEEYRTTMNKLRQRLNEVKGV